MNYPIRTIYRIEVNVPEAVFRRFGHTPEYGEFALSAAKLVEASGQDSYSSVYEWGEAPTREQVEAFGRAWAEQINQWRCAT